MRNRYDRRERSGVPKDAFQRAQDFAAAVGLTCLVIGLAIGLALAHLAKVGCSP